MDIIKFENVEKSYDGNKNIIDNLNLSIERGEFVTIIGQSGCGKTTLLKLINGLVKPDKGSIYVYGKEIKEWDIINLRREIGYVIQQIGLFPHMTVQDNIGYVLSINNIDKDEIKKTSENLINLVGLNTSYLDKYPRELSGGQKQRVGVARALASNSDIILMDEPFGAVDEINRRMLQDEILSIQKELNKTIIFVTHDIEEAFKLGTKIILFDKGKIVQCGTKKDLLLTPKNDFVGEFFGYKDFVAYLNCIKVNEVVVPFNNEENLDEEICLDSSILTINKDKSIMEALKLLISNRVEYLIVEDENNNIIGKISIKDLNISI